MKMENIKLSEEVLAFKNCFVDMNEMTSKIQTACKLACHRSYKYLHNFNSMNKTMRINYLSLLVFPLNVR